MTTPQPNQTAKRYWQTWAIQKWQQTTIQQWLKQWHDLHRLVGRNGRWQRTKQRLIQIATSLLLGASFFFPFAGHLEASNATFAERNGTTNPFNGVDVGSRSTPTFVDLDADGDLDMFSGQGAGVIFYYENTGTPLNPTFTERTGANNPVTNETIIGGISFSLFSVYQSMPSFVDIDHDGDFDLFIGTKSSGITFFENTGNAENALFTARIGADNPLAAASNYAAPSFVDIDGDGDFDLFSGSRDGTITYYENTGTAVSPTFAVQSSPLGTIDVGLNSHPNFEDLDGDGDFDALIGSQEGLIHYFENTGSALNPLLVEQTSNNNPFNGINVGDANMPTLTDIDGDGDFDAFMGNYDGIIHYYENVGDNTAVSVFNEQTGTNNPFNGIDLGSDSKPATADLEKDGDIDTLIGESDGTLNYYQNDGTIIAPTFAAQAGSDNPFNGIDVGSGSAPTFVDIDADGDIDAFIGESAGNTNYYQNTGSAITPTFAAQTGSANPFNAIDIGDNNTPTFIDIDQDGDFDAFIGEASGAINYYKNTGSAITPTFTAQTGANNPFNGIDVGSNSTPSFIDTDRDGDFDAFIGNSDGSMHYYENTGTPLAPVFAERIVGNPLDETAVGGNSAANFADLDGDGDADALIGASSGELSYFQHIVLCLKVYLPLITRP